MSQLKEQIQSLLLQINEQAQRIGELHYDLERYGSCLPGCEVYLTGCSDLSVCDCGFMAAIAKEKGVT